MVKLFSYNCELKLSSSSLYIMSQTYLRNGYKKIMGMFVHRRERFQENVTIRSLIREKQRIFYFLLFFFWCKFNYQITSENKKL